MTLKERIKAEVDEVSDERLDELYSLVRQFKKEPEPREGRPSLMSRLKRIKIDAPEDFAANLDLYLSGEKSVDPDLR
jgi:hypothetical protein